MTDAPIVGRMRTAMRERLSDLVLWNDLLQWAKTATAAVVAWVLARHVFTLEQPFLAPWAALLVVHATVHRTLTKGAQQVAATVLAVLLASGAGQVLGPGTPAVIAVIVLGLLLGALPWMGAEATTIAATGLVVVTTGFSDDRLLIARLLDTAVGVGVGLAVNALLWPPLRRRTAIRAIDRIDDAIGALLGELADDLPQADAERPEQWVERTRDIDRDIDDAWAMVRQAKESAALNARKSAGEYKDPQEWYALLRRMEQANAEIRSMARTLRREHESREDWEPEFTERWPRLVHSASTAIGEPDSDAIEQVCRDLNELMDDLGGRRLRHWPVYGGLMVNLRNVLEAMVEVAKANPLEPQADSRSRSRSSAMSTIMSS